MGLESSWRLRLPEFSDNRHMKVARLSPLRTSGTYPPPPPPPAPHTLVLISVRGWVDLRAIMRPEGLGQWKTSKLPSGIEHAALRLVVQRLNQMCYRVPQYNVDDGCTGLHKEYQRNNAMVLTTENGSTRRKICPSATLTTTNPTWTGLGFWHPTSAVVFSVSGQRTVDDFPEHRNVHSRSTEDVKFLHSLSHQEVIINNSAPRVGFLMYCTIFVSLFITNTLICCLCTTLQMLEHIYNDNRSGPSTIGHHQVFIYTGLDHLKGKILSFYSLS